MKVQKDYCRYIYIYMICDFIPLFYTYIPMTTKLHLKIYTIYLSTIIFLFNLFNIFNHTKQVKL